MSSMKLKVVDARKQRLADTVFRKLAEIEEHPEIAMWDIAAYEGDIEKATVGFRILYKVFQTQKTSSSWLSLTGQLSALLEFTD
jgi:hypothetical protein